MLQVVALLQERIAELETRLKANAQGHSKQVEELHQKIAELQAEIEWLRWFPNVETSDECSGLAWSASLPI